MVLPNYTTATSSLIENNSKTSLWCGNISINMNWISLTKNYVSIYLVNHSFFILNSGYIVSTFSCSSFFLIFLMRGTRIFVVRGRCYDLPFGQAISLSNHSFFYYIMVWCQHIFSFLSFCWHARMIYICCLLSCSSVFSLFLSIDI